MTTAGGRAARPLWRDRNFSIFWAAQTLSAAGDSFAYIAVPLLVLRATGSVAQMGLLTGVAGTASVCAGIAAGVLVDRLDGRRTRRTGKAAGRSSSPGGAAIAAVGLTRAVAVIATAAATYLACESVAGTCSMSLRQEVTPDHLLGRVTSAFWTIHFALGPVGAVLLGWAAGRYGVGPVLVTVGAGCSLLAALALFTPIRLAAPEQMSTAA